MTELQRHRLKEVASTFGISYAISFASLPAVPRKNASVLMTVLLFGTAFGALFYFGGKLGNKARHKSFVVTLLLQALLNLGIILAALTLALWPFVALNQGMSMLDPRLTRIPGYIFTTAEPLLSLGGAFLLALLISSVFQISKKLGPGVLWNWLTGRYHDPREEQRVFMFLDLKDSTMLAEKLGNLRFSALVRDFFADLTKPVIETRGEVSHYIGDEAVLTWLPERGLKKANCVEVFFKLRAQIESRRDHYLKQYGVVPGFKAGAHIGPVVATEVGEIKSEIVYHGDVLNTAARIQSHCNEFNAELLVSEDLLNALSLPNDRYASFRGRFLFKGKEHEVGVYEVSDLSPEQKEMARMGGREELKATVI